MKGIYVNQFFILDNVSFASFLCLLIFSYKGGEQSYKRHLQPIFSGSVRLLLLSSYHKAGATQSITSALRLSSLLLDASSPSSSHQHFIELMLPSSWMQDLCICSHLSHANTELHSVYSSPHPMLVFLYLLKLPCRDRI